MASIIRNGLILTVGMLVLGNPLHSRRKTDIDICVKAALANSLELESATEELLMKKDLERVCLSRFIPEIVASTSIRQDNSNSRFSTTGMTIRGDIFLWDDRWEEYRKTALEYNIEQIEYSELRKQVVLEIIEIFTRIMTRRLELENYKYSREILRKEELVIKDLYRSGNSTEFDLISAELEVRDYELKIQHTEKDISILLLELEQKTGLVIENPDQLVEIEFVDPSENLNCRESAQLRKQSVLSELYEKDKGILRNKLFPQIYFSAYYEWKNVKYWQDSYEIYDYQGNYITRDNSRHYWEISLNICYPLGDLTRRIFEYRIASRKLTIHRNKTDQLAAELFLKNATILEKLKSLGSEIELHRSNLELAERKAALALERYHSGLIDFSVYADSFEDLNNSKLGLKEIESEYILILAEWQSLTDQRILGKF